MKCTTLETLEGEEFTVHARVSHRTNQNFKAPIENTGNIRNTNLQSVLKFKRKSKRSSYQPVESVVSESVPKDIITAPY